MTRWLSMLTALWLSSASAQFGGLIKDITGAITKEVAAVKDPIDKTVAFIGSSSCKHVKKILGVAYEQYDNDELDLSKLTLVFSTNETKTIYKLVAASKINSCRWFNPRNKLIIYFHGFTDNPEKDSYNNINTAFFKQGNFNVLALDASSLIHWFYTRSTTMVRFIGGAMGAALTVMIKAGMNPSDIHLIGHSLGAHIAGFTGKTTHKLSGRRVGRITGLDPAGPCFSNVEPALRLDKYDADFVDIIHTDADVYGLNGNIGHVDFFPNSGSEQPECLLQTCSHSRAWQMYAESVINPAGFPAISCKDWKEFKNGKCDQNNISLMGYGCTPGTTGHYYLQTAGSSPYALGMKGTTYNNTSGVVKGIRDGIGLWK